MCVIEAAKTWLDKRLRILRLEPYLDTVAATSLGGAV